MFEESPQDHDFGKEVIPKSIGKRRVFSYPFEGYWSDIGTIRSFFEANLMLAQLEGQISRYVRSDFRHRPTEHWDDQWALLSAQLLREVPQTA